ncbi:MAG: glycogen-binding domain-containing protein [Treponema sp.]|nr:glycogen-binding domain-containing protein [Treponema sp.]
MRKICIVTMALFLAAASVYGQSPAALPIDDADYAEIASTISEVRAPYMKGDYVIFTQKKEARYIGIAFDFEKYRSIHQFQIKELRDENYNVKDSLFFYILKLPKNVQTVNYRLVVDGLWTTDPQNIHRQYNDEAGVELSQLNANRSIPLVTEKKENGCVRFVYTGPSGQHVRLGGSFTNWDSWIYELKEVSPGQYQCDLPLPPGTYQYAYYTGVKSFPDKTNPQRCYTQDGKVASQIVVH